MMSLKLFILIACTAVTLAGCVVEPYGERRRGDYYHDRGDRDDHEYGRRVWRE